MSKPNDKYVPVISWREGVLLGNLMIHGLGFNRDTKEPMMLVKGKPLSIKEKL